MLKDQNMMEPRWTFSNPTDFTRWYGHVDYYGEYVIGKWFTLDAKSGRELWSRQLNGMQVAVYATPAGGGYEISVEAEYGGNYIITGLLPGDYEIRALFIEVIGGEPQTPVEATNEIYPVAVVAGQNTAEIDIHLLE